MRTLAAIAFALLAGCTIPAVPQATPSPAPSSALWVDPAAAGVPVPASSVREVEFFPASSPPSAGATQSPTATDVVAASVVQSTAAPTRGPTSNPTAAPYVPPAPIPVADTSGPCGPGQVYVNSYVRKDGTHVSGYCRRK